MLELRDVEVRYGGIRALRGVGLDVREGEAVALLGANGAGKTSTLRAISGLVRPAAGSIRYLGEPIAGLRPDKIACLGIGHVPEGRRVFARMSVRENLTMGGYRVASAALVRDRIDEALTIFPRLRERFDQSAGTLSGGEQQMLAIGRALVSAPRLLLLDEPSLGLSPLLAQTIFGVLRTLHERGATMLLVEQNARAALRIVDRGYVLANGAIVREDAAGRLLDDPAVVAAYLGTG